MTQVIDRDRDISALLCARICHDLISPIGAIGNGLELLTMELGGSRPEMALIADSVANANARIRLFRLAFGQAHGSGQGVQASEVVSILTDLKRGSRTKIDWNIPAALMRREAKFALLGFMCLDSAMPHGGAVTITRREDGYWHIGGKATRLRVQEPLWTLLKTGIMTEDITSADAHFAVFAQELRHHERQAEISFTEGEIHLIF